MLIYPSIHLSICLSIESICLCGIIIIIVIVFLIFFITSVFIRHIALLCFRIKVCWQLFPL